VPTIIRFWPEASEPPSIAVSELENPTTHGLVRHVEAALGQQILDVSEAQREAAIEPYGVLDDLGRESVAAIGDRFHRRRLDYCRSMRKPINVTAPANVSDLDIKVLNQFIVSKNLPDIYHEVRELL
jgi:hypothetical protein